MSDRMSGVATRVAYALRSRPLLRLLSPAALWVALAVVSVIQDDPERAWSWYLRVLPLVAVLSMAAGHVDDPAAELLMTTPTRAWKRVADHALAGFLILAAHVATFRLLLLGLGATGGWAGDPPFWRALGGSFALAALSTAVAVVAARDAAGTAFGTATWLVELLFGSALAASRAGRDVYIFLCLVVPWTTWTKRMLLENQAAWWALAVASAAAVLALQRHEERLLPRNVD